MGLAYRFFSSGRVCWKPLALAAAACVGLASLSSTSTAADKKEVVFKKDIQPIFKSTCVKCHSENPRDPKKKPKGGLRLDDKEAALKGGEDGPVIVPGKAADSLLYQVLTGPVKHGDDEIPAMPPAKKGEKFKPLPDSKVELIKQWIDEGAKWE